MQALHAYYIETRPCGFKQVLTLLFDLTTNQRTMDDDNLTISSLTTELDNLIELHRLSRLPITHDLRQLKSGFLIRADRLPNYVPLPGSKIERRS